MPKGLSICRIIALVNCLAKLHNFCIDEVDSSLLQSLNIDTAHMMNNEDGYVPMDASNEHGVPVPRALMSAGHHFRDISQNERQQQERCNPEGTLPPQYLLQQVIDSHLRRPVVT